MATISINHAIWGDAENWHAIAPSVYVVRTANADGWAGNAQIGNMASIWHGIYGALSGTSPLNNQPDDGINLTISPWRIPSDADIANVMVPLWCNHMTDLNNYSTDPADMQADIYTATNSGDQSALPAIPIIDANATARTLPDCTTFGRIANIDYTVSPNAGNTRSRYYSGTYRYVSPIVQFNYHNIVLLIYVRVYNPTTHSTTTVTLGDYDNNINNIRDTHTDIIGYYTTPYIATSSTTRTANNTGLVIAPLKYANNAPVVSSDVVDGDIVSAWQHQALLSISSNWGGSRTCGMGVSPANNVNSPYGVASISTLQFFATSYGYNYANDRRIFANDVSRGIDNWYTVRSAYGDAYTPSADNNVDNAGTGIYSLYTPYMTGNSANWQATYDVAATGTHMSYHRVVWRGTTDDIRRQVAYMGLWFTGSVDAATNGIMGTDDNVYLPIFTDDGTTTGDYVGGSAARNQPNYTWTDDVLDRSPYQPTGSTADIHPIWPSDDGTDNPGGDDDGKSRDDHGDLSSVLSSHSINAGLIYYAVSDLSPLMAWVNDIGASDDSRWDYDFMGINPHDYIATCMYYPYGIPVSGPTAPIPLGPLTSPATGIHIPYSAGPGSPYYYDFGTVHITRVYQDFRDFPPYTTAKLYLPYVADMDIDIGIWYDHDMRITANVDIATGTITCYIWRDNLIVSTSTGQCGVKIPLSATNMGDYQSAIIGAENAAYTASLTNIGTWLGVVGGIVGVGAAAATGGAALPVAIGALGTGVISGIRADAQSQLADYRVQHIAPHIGTTQCADPLNGAVAQAYARLIITRPQPLARANFNVYAHTTGYACNISDTLANFRGYTVCGQVSLDGIPATADEINIITNALLGGVYL